MDAGLASNTRLRVKSAKPRQVLVLPLYVRGEADVPVSVLDRPICGREV